MSINKDVNISEADDISKIRNLCVKLEIAAAISENTNISLKEYSSQTSNVKQTNGHSELFSKCSVYLNR